MASSIHIQSGGTGFFSHNSREKKTVNAKFNDEENFISCSNATAIKFLKDEITKREKEYIKKTGRKKLHSKTITHLSAVLNLEKHHTEDDLIKVCDYLEETLNTKIIQFAIHRDEGIEYQQGDYLQKQKMDKMGVKFLKNYHAHIEFLGLDSMGNSVRRKLTKQYLKDLQTNTANLLGMERGKEGSKARRLDTYDFKQKREEETSIQNKIIEQAKQVISTEQAKQKDLKEQIRELRAELQEQRAKREDYAKLEQLNKELKEKIKQKDLSIDELRNELLNARETIFNQKEHIDSLENDLSRLRADMEVLEHRNKSYFGLNQNLKEEILNLKEKITELEKIKTTTTKQQSESQNEVSLFFQYLEDIEKIGLLKNIKWDYLQQYIRTKGLNEAISSLYWAEMPTADYGCDINTYANNVWNNLGLQEQVKFLQLERKIPYALMQKKQQILGM